MSGVPGGDPAATQRPAPCREAARMLDLAVAQIEVAMGEGKDDVELF